MKTKIASLVLFVACTVNLYAQPGLFVEKNKLLLCGHRGGFYSELPENSMAAFEFTASVNQSSRIIVEFDIRKSKDGTLFILHDETVDRTTNGRGKIEELSDTYLKTLFLKNEQGELTQEKIPTYATLLNYAEKNQNILLMLDVKAEVWEEAIKGLTERRLQSRSIILTFAPTDTKKVYALAQDIAISCLSTDEAKWSAIEALNIPGRNLIAYIGPSTSASLLVRIRDSGVALMTDASEHTTYQGELYPEVFYKELVIGKRLSILITDFPTAVSRFSFN